MYVICDLCFQLPSDENSTRQKKCIRSPVFRLPQLSEDCRTISFRRATELLTHSRIVIHGGISDFFVVVCKSQVPRRRFLKGENWFHWITHEQCANYIRLRKNRLAFRDVAGESQVGKNRLKQARLAGIEDALGFRAVCGVSPGFADVADYKSTPLSKTWHSHESVAPLISPLYARDSHLQVHTYSRLTFHYRDDTIFLFLRVT